MDEIKSEWNSLHLSFDRGRPEVPLIESLEDIVECLDVHSLDLMGMAAQGRFVDFCRADMEEWQSTLRFVDTVLQIWTKVQKNWQVCNFLKTVIKLHTCILTIKLHRCI